MESVVLLVEGNNGVADIIRRHLEPARWRVEHHLTSDTALVWLEQHTPQLTVLDVDIPRGWNVCTQLRKVLPDVPVIIVSRRFGRDVFIEHQKLETRADAYHQLPQDEPAFGITLGLYATRRPPAPNEPSQSGFRVVTRQRLHSTQSRGISPAPGANPAPPPVPNAGPAGDIIARLEQKAADQAREVERLKQLVVALEVERDAVKENAHRQAMQLMSLQTATDASAEQELLHLKQRVAQLETEALATTARGSEAGEQALAGLRKERDELLKRLGDATAERRQAVDAATARATQLATELDALKAEFATRENGWRGERISLQQQLNALNALEGDDTVQVSTDILDRTREDARQQATEAADQLARASTQLSQLATELAQAHRDRMELQQKVQALETRLAEVAAAAVSSDSLAAAEARLAEAVARAETAESAWSGLNARLEQTHRLLDERTRDVDQLTLGRKDTENALATSRKLMREYAAEAGRKAEELREADQRLRALETEVGTLCARADDAQREADFQRSLVAMLEVEVAQFKTSPPPPPVDPLADERAARLSGRVAGARDEVLRLRTFLDIAQGSLEALIERVASDFETATASLHAVTLALVEEEGVVPPAPPEDAGDEAPEEPPPPPESV